MASGTDLFCPGCGYNLRGIASELCPECGKGYERSLLSSSRIPWTNRGRISYIGAFVKTVWVATAHPKRIGESLQAELTVWDGRVFMVLSMLPIGVAVAGLLLTVVRNELIMAAMQRLVGPSGMAWPVDLLYPLYRGFSLWPVCVGVAACLCVGLGLMPARVALFGRYPEGLKQRVVAGAHYLAGAWLGGAIAGAFVAILFAVLLVATSGQARLISAWPGALAWTSAVFVPITTLLVWVNAWHVYRRTAAGLAGRRTLPSTLVIPPLLLLYLFLWLLLIPWCIGLLVLIGSTLLG